MCSLICEQWFSDLNLVLYSEKQGKCKIIIHNKVAHMKLKLVSVKSFSSVLIKELPGVTLF